MINKLFKKVNSKKNSKKQISLCVGGGGANGFSAVPIINEVLKQECEIIAISGCSVGAIIGAYLAKYKEIDSLNTKLIKNSKLDWLKLVDLSNPTKQFMKGKKIKLFLEEIFQDTTFEELDTPLTIVATNISKKESIYFTSGKLIDAIMASISIPGIFPPYQIDEEFYFDGMLSENVPITPLLKYNSRIVAIDFFYNETLVKKLPRTLIESLVYHLL